MEDGLAIFLEDFFLMVFFSRRIFNLPERAILTKSKSESKKRNNSRVCP